MVIHAFGTSDMFKGWNEVELKDYNGCGNNHRLWVRSDRLITIANTDKLDIAREEILFLRRENAKLKDENAKLKEAVKKATTETNKPQVSEAPAQAANYDPVETADKISDGGARPLLINSAGEEAVKFNVEKPFRCDTCGERYANKDSLKNHRYKKHSANGQEKMWHCETCGKTYKVASWYTHPCIKNAKKNKNKTK